MNCGLEIPASPPNQSFGSVGVGRARLRFSTELDGGAEKPSSRQTFRGGGEAQEQTLAKYNARSNRIYSGYPEFSFLFFPHAIHHLSLFSLSPRRNSNPRSHSRLFPTLPPTVRAFNFCREKASALSSFVDSRRIAPTHARRRTQFLTPFFFIFEHKFKTSPRWESNSRTNASFIRG